MDSIIARKVLEVEPTDTEQDIKRKYKKYMKKYHPDNLETGNSFKYKRGQDAYEIIKENLAYVKSKSQINHSNNKMQGNNGENNVQPGKTRQKSDNLNTQIYTDYRMTHGSILGEVNKVEKRYKPIKR